MTNSFHDLFYICVQILKDISTYTGLTYEEANIWIFVIIHPLITAVLTLIVLKNAYKKSRIHNKRTS